MRDATPAGPAQTEDEARGVVTDTPGGSNPSTGRTGDSDADLMAALGNARIRFWACPTPSHRDRRDENGRPVVTVEWRGNTAHCTTPGCANTSAGTGRLVWR